MIFILEEEDNSNFLEVVEKEFSQVTFWVILALESCSSFGNKKQPDLEAPQEQLMPVLLVFQYNH